MTVTTAGSGDGLERELERDGLERDEAEGLARAVRAALTRAAPAEAWRGLTRGALQPTQPFAVHARVHAHVFAAWDASVRGPAPAWVPSADESEGTRIAAWMRRHGFARYSELHAWSVEHREEFWGEVLAELDLRFERAPERVLDDARGAEDARWLPGARLNIASSCFGADSERPAIVAGAPGRPPWTVTYGALERRSARVAAALVAAGFRPGDALAIDMPMTPSAVEIYLGIVRAGMVVVSIADALASEEIATRLELARAAGIFTALEVVRGGKRLPLYAKVRAAGAPRAIVVGAGSEVLRDGDEDYAAFLERAASPWSHADRIGAPEDPINLLFSSGTTGTPKAIPWTHLTPIKAAADALLHFDLRAGEVVAWPTNLGWMMGPWLIFATLLNRASLALFEDAPTTRDFGEFLVAARVNVLGLVPSIVKAWRSDERMRGLDLSAIRCFGSTGEASSPDDSLYLMGLAGYRPVLEYCGGTEIGGGYLTGTLLQPGVPAAFTTPALGSRIVVLDPAGRPCDSGEAFLVPPTLGESQRLLGRDHHALYFEGTPRGPAGEVLRRHGDRIERLPGGHFRAHGRVDDTMNLGGIKVGSAEIERVLEGVAGVARCAAIAVPPPGGGPDRLVVVTVLRVDASPEGLARELQSALSARLNPLFRIHEVVVVEALPLTASNKVVRRTLRERLLAGELGSANGTGADLRGPRRR